MKRATWYALAIAALLAFGACSKAPDPAAPHGPHPWTHHGVFRFTEFQNPNTLNPLLGQSAAVGDISMFVFSYAVRFDDKARPVPDALTEVPTVANGDVSKDGLTLKYKLRHDITFQDGVPLTCEDMKFTWHVVMNPRTNVSATDGYRDIRDVDCHDPYVAVVHMKRVYAPYLQQLWGLNGNAPILPEHLLKKYNDSGSINNAPYNALPIGSGPFRVVQWQRDSFVRMVAYPKFFRGAPKLKEVVFQITPDENTAQTRVQTHEVDMLSRGTGLNWPRYEALGNDSRNGVQAIRVDSFLFDHIDFNLERKLLQDRAVRTALAFATDRNEINEKIFHGSVTPSETDQHPSLSWAYTSDIEHHPYDPAKARAVLDAAGWHAGPDGVRVKNGERLEFTLSTQTESPANKAIQALLQREWRDVGVAADVKNYPTSELFANGNAGIIEGGHFDAAIFAWVEPNDPDDSSLYSSDNFAPRGQNVMYWKDAKATAAMRDALDTVDQRRRTADYAIVQQELAKEVPTIIIGFRREPYVYNTDLKGFTASPVISPFWNPWEYEL